jgi:hypothetical protein
METTKDTGVDGASGEGTVAGHGTETGDPGGASLVVAGSGIAAANEDVDPDGTGGCVPMSQGLAIATARKTTAAADARVSMRESLRRPIRLTVGPASGGSCASNTTPDRSSSIDAHDRPRGHRVKDRGRPDAAHGRVLVSDD